MKGHTYELGSERVHSQWKAKIEPVLAVESAPIRPLSSLTSALFQLAALIARPMRVQA